MRSPRTEDVPVAPEIIEPGPYRTELWCLRARSTGLHRRLRRAAPKLVALIRPGSKIEVVFSVILEGLRAFPKGMPPAMSLFPASNPSKSPPFNKQHPSNRGAIPSRPPFLRPALRNPSAAVVSAGVASRGEHPAKPCLVDDLHAERLRLFEFAARLRARQQVIGLVAQAAADLAAAFEDGFRDFLAPLAQGPGDDPARSRKRQPAAPRRRAWPGRVRRNSAPPHAAAPGSRGWPGSGKTPTRSGRRPRRCRARAGPRPTARPKARPSCRTAPPASARPSRRRAGCPARTAASTSG